MSDCIGKIAKLETFGLVDGPGGGVSFAQGCHLRCKFYHNPEKMKRLFDKASVRYVKEV